MRLSPVILAMALLTLSCSKSVVRNSEQERELAFEVIVAASTRSSLAQDSDYPADGSFAVWALSLPEGMSFPADALKARETVSGVRVIHDYGRRFKPEQTLMWGGYGERMSFFAVSPYGRATGFDTADGITVEDYSCEEGGGLLFSRDLFNLGKDNNFGVVQLQFHRALALVRFNMQSSLPSGCTIVVRKLTLEGVRKSGDFRTLPAPEWDCSGREGEDMTFFEGEFTVGESPVSISEGMFMIPQTIPNMGVRLTFDIVYEGVKPMSYTLEADCAMSWGIGRICSYTLKISSDLGLTIEKDIDHDEEL